MTVLQHIKSNTDDISTLYRHITSLVSIPSFTPDDNGCQEYIANYLTGLGFECSHLPSHGVSNLIAKLGTGPKIVAFAGHTDVVPTGDESLWRAPPFGVETLDGEIYGRGVADMKGGIAAMMTAIEQTYSQLNMDNFTFMFLITSDEEGEAEFGTRVMVDYLHQHNLLPNYCIVGEPTASLRTGDVVKVGRRGAVSAEILVTGKQGHAAYPKFAVNAVHIAADIASWLNHLSWDQGSDDFPGTSLQITGLDSGIWTDNIIPGSCRLSFNIRYSHKYDENKLCERIESGLAQLPHQTEITWLRPCAPYFTDNTRADGIQLIEEVERAIYKVTHRFPRLSTSGGTSDGRFIAHEKCQVIELGVPNQTIHQVNERVKVDDLITLTKIYQELLINLMA